MVYTKTEGEFLSKDEKTKLHYYAYFPEKVPFAVLQICHGLCEHIERYEYEGFVESMTEAGIAVCGFDFTGHGKTALSREELGCISSVEILCEDICSLREIMRKKYRSLPYIVIGHGFGSLVLREYITRHNNIDGAVICGTAYNSFPKGFAKFLSKLFVKLRGENFKSGFLTKLVFGNSIFNISADNKDSAYTSVSDVRYRKENDPLCRFEPSAFTCFEVLSLLNRVNDTAWSGKLPLSLPIFLVAGEDDPVGDNGEGVKEVCTLLDDAEMTEIKYKLYENTRHEVYFDINKKTAVDELIAWIGEVADGVVACRSANAMPFGRVSFD